MTALFRKISIKYIVENCRKIKQNKLISSFEQKKKGSMIRHSKKAFDSSQFKEINEKPVEEFFKELVSLSFLVSTPCQSATVKRNQNELSLKIDYLKSFLQRFKQCFNRSTTNRSQSFTETSRISFEKELISNKEPLCTLLIFCITRIESITLRLLALRSILYLTHFKSFKETFTKLGIDVYIIRLIDLNPSDEDVALAIEYIRALCQLHPNDLTKAHVYCLSSHLEDTKSKLNSLVLETILEITNKLPKLACECKIFNDLIDYVVNACPDGEFFIEIIIQTLCKLIDDPECRQLLDLNYIFANLLAPIVDFDYVPLPYANSSNVNFFKNDQTSNESEPKIELVLNACSTALNMLFSSYVGIMSFSVNQNKNIEYLLSPFSWFLESNKTDITRSFNSFAYNSASSLAHSNTHSTMPKRKLSKSDQIISRQLLILNTLLTFFYKLFGISGSNASNLLEKLNKQNVAQESRTTITPAFTNSYGSNVMDSLEEDFICSECYEILEPIDQISSQSNTDNLSDEHKLKIYSTSPNLAVCFRSYILKTFIEASLFEKLLDLYFGLPLSFLQPENNMPTNHACFHSNYQSISFRCLNLFAELYYLANNLFHNEYCIDSFKANVDKQEVGTDSPYNSNQSIYNQLKKLSLVSYLKYLNDVEREKEVIIYLTEFNAKKESIKNGSMMPEHLLGRLSFFGQKFLSNSCFFNAKIYEIEQEILNTKKARLQSERQASASGSSMDSGLIFDLVSFIMSDDTASRDRRLVQDVEKKLEEHLDLTLVLQVESNICLYDIRNVQHQQAKREQEAMFNFNWDWLEIINVFESYLLTSSSIHPKFIATQDSILLNSNQERLLNENQKLMRFVKKLLDFFIIENSSSKLNNNQNEHVSSTPPRSSYYSSSLRSSTSSNFLFSPSSNISDLILCAGCYLIDFILDKFNIVKFNESSSMNFPQQQQQEKTINLSSCEYLLIKLLYNIKKQLMSEYPIRYDSMKESRESATQRDSINSSAAKISLSKDSTLTYYVLFVGHLTASYRGKVLLKRFDMFALFTRIVEQYRDVSLMKLIVASFNFYTSTESRNLLTTCMCLSFRTFAVMSNNTNANDMIVEYVDFKIFALKAIFNIFRANSLKFECFFLNIMIKALLVYEELVEFSVDKQDLLHSQNQQFFELSLNLIEYFVNLRPDFVEQLFVHDQTDMLRLSKLAQQLNSSNTKAKLFSNSKLIKIKLQLLLLRLKLTESRLDQMSFEQFATFLNEWNDSNLFIRYFELIERNLFDSNAINANFVNESEQKYAESETEEEKIGESDARCPYSANENYKLYRKINSPLNKNNRIYFSMHTQTYVPFHLNTAIIRYKKFLDNNFFLTEAYETMIVEQLRLIKLAAHSISNDLEINKSSASSFSRKRALKKLKASMWSIASLCICENGFKYLSVLNNRHNIFANLFDFTTFLIKLTEESPQLSIRGTGFCCLNLISKSCTGANLIGMLGWHTFQPNRASPAKAFYSILNSLSYQEYDMDVYSSIDTAVVLYNIKRSNASVSLKRIDKYYNCEISNYEKEFLKKQELIDEMRKVDSDMIKNYDVNKIGFYFENISIPIRTSLMAAEVNLMRNTVNNFEIDVYERDCSGCFYCYLKLNVENLFPTRSESTGNEKLVESKEEILKLIDQIIVPINIGKKMANLNKLRKTNAHEFNWCLLNFIHRKYFSNLQLKFQLRKYLQELFIELKF